MSTKPNERRPLAGREMMIDYANLCGECDEAESHPMHGDWKPEYAGKVHLRDMHEYVRGCYCGDRGKCEVCVDKAVDMADHMRDVAKEDGL